MEIHKKSIGKGGVRELHTKIPTSTADPLWERQNVWKYIGKSKGKGGVHELCAKIPTSTADPLGERQNVWKDTGNP